MRAPSVATDAEGGPTAIDNPAYPCGGRCECVTAEGGGATGQSGGGATGQSGGGATGRPAGGGRGAPHPVYWVIAAALVVIATVLVVRDDRAVLPPAAFGQGVTSGGARGVFAFSGQLSKNTYGVYMVDMDAMTMWVYEYLPQKGCLRLAGARTWRYDRYLENHNICDLPPDVVEQMIEEQRQYRMQSSESQMP